MKLEEVEALGKALLVSRANVNNCSTLLDLISNFSRSSASPDCVLEAVRCLQAFFLPILSSEGVLGKSEDARGNDAETIYREWLQNKLDEFTGLLIKMIADDGDARLQKAALDALMELQVNGGRVNNKIYYRVCAALVRTRQLNEKIYDLVAEYCRDMHVCFFTISNLKKLVILRLAKSDKGHDRISSDDDDDRKPRQGVSVHNFVRNIYEIASRVSPFIQEVLKGSNKDKVSEQPSENEFDIKRFKSNVRAFWQNFLQLPLPLDVYKKVLVDMPKVVFSTIANPIRLSDFLTKSYDIGGLYSVLALDGLYILMTKYGLEYPEFYDKLYALLEPSIFLTKYRSRFFELLDSCLKSPLLPAYLAAAFAKKLSRLSLSASPAGALIVIAMVHNLLRRHPSINCLVHLTSRPKTDRENPEVGRLRTDPFVASETKTSECRALESSLWEIESLRRHYCPVVSRFVSTLETDLTVRAKTTEVQISDFSSGSYSTIFKEETRRRLKQVPLSYYKVVPGTLFPENTEDFGGWSFRIETDTDVVGKKRKAM